MKRLGPLMILFFAAGCSNAPLAGTLDCLFPSKAGKGGPARPADTDTLPSPRLPTTPAPDDTVPPRGTLQSLPRDRDDDRRPAPNGLEEPLAPLPAPGFIDPKK